MSTNISYANIEAAVELLESGALDRNSIAASLGISITSARNIASFLLDNSIVGEYQKTSSKNKRKTNALYLLSDPIFAVSDIYKDKIVTHLFGYNLNISDRITYNIDDTLFWDDSFTSYLRNVLTKYPKLCSICFICDGIPENGKFVKSSISVLNSISLPEMVQEHIRDIPVILENRCRYIVGNTPGFSSVISESEGTLHTSVLLDGRIISRCASNPFYGGDTRYGIRSFNKRVYYSENSDEYVSAFADILHLLFCLINIDRIYFASDRYSETSFLIKRIIEELMLKYDYSTSQIPELIPTEYAVAASSLSLRRSIRNSCIKNFL